jgi:hypothetical protein
MRKVGQFRVAKSIDEIRRAEPAGWQRTDNESKNLTPVRQGWVSYAPTGRISIPLDAADFVMREKYRTLSVVWISVSKKSSWDLTESRL